MDIKVGHPKSIRPKRVPVWELIRRGFKCRCPRCGVCPIFESYFELVEKCRGCGLPIHAREEDTYFFMYLSAGFITGCFIIGLFFFVPKDKVLANVLLFVSSILIYLLSQKPRKGLAIALDYFVDSRSEFPKHQ
jgi:uncharacterized protein (DUF983 family)